MNIYRLPSPFRCLIIQQIDNLQACRRHLSIEAVSASQGAPSILQSLESDYRYDEPQTIQTLNRYNASAPPNVEQAKIANKFWSSQKPELLFSHANFRDLPESKHPEIVFLGRSNVGKSSLLNALFKRNGVALISKRPGKTKLLNGFGVSPHPLSEAPKQGTKGDIMAESWRRMRQGLIVVDTPGYGSGGRQTWGQEILKYLEKRKQLRRAFLLVDSEHGLKKTDVQLLQHLHQTGVPHTLVLSKVDKFLQRRSTPAGPIAFDNGVQKLMKQMDDINLTLKLEVWRGRPVPTDLLCLSAEKCLDGQNKMGVTELRWAGMAACGIVDAS